MAITKKLMRLGNSYGLVIDKSILELLGIDANTPLEISTPNGSSLLIKPVHQAQKDKIQNKFKEALEQGNQLYGPALKKLAKGEDEDKSGRTRCQ